MANFDGFQIGQQLGKGIALPLDTSPVTNYFLQRQQMHDAQRAELMKQVGNELASYDPNKIMDKDLPDFYNLYNQYKDAVIENPDVMIHPQKDLNKYTEIQSIKNRLTNLTVQSRDQKMLKGELMKSIVSERSRGRTLSPNALQSWDQLNSVPTLKMQQPLDITDFSYQMSPKDVENDLRQINYLTPKKNVDVPIAGGKQIQSYTAPNYNSLMSQAANVFELHNSDYSPIYEQRFNNLTPDKIAGIKSAIKSDIADRLGPDVLGQGTYDALSNFDIKTPQDLYMADVLLQNQPIIGGIKVNPLWKEQQSLDLRKQQIGMSWSKFYQTQDRLKQNQLDNDLRTEYDMQIRALDRKAFDKYKTEALMDPKATVKLPSEDPTVRDKVMLNAREAVLKRMGAIGSKPISKKKASSGINFSQSTINDPFHP